MLYLRYELNQNHKIKTQSNLKVLYLKKKNIKNGPK